MRKPILSLEDADLNPEPAPESEATPEAVAELETELAVSEARRAEDEAEVRADELEEAESISEATDAIADSVDASLEPTQERQLDEEGKPVVDAEGKEVTVEVPGEGLDEEEARRVEATMEHFQRRLKLKKPIVPSMEGFKNEKTRREKTVQLSANLRKLSAALNAKIVASQEGWWDNLKHRFGAAFSSAEKIGKEAPIVERSLLDRGFKEEVLKSPGFAQTIPTQGGQGSGADVIKALEESLKALKNPAIAAGQKKSIRHFEDSIHELKSNGGAGTDISEASVERLRKFVGETEAMIKELPEPGALHTGDKKADFAPVKDAAEAKKIISLVEAITTESKKLTEESDKIWEIAWDAHQAYKSRYRGDDLKLVNQIGSNLDEVWSRVCDIDGKAVVQAYAALQYVKASIK